MKPAIAAQSAMPRGSRIQARGEADVAGAVDEVERDSAIQNITSADERHA